jgi:hypothetical protein
MKMKKFQVSANGIVFDIYEADTEQEAIEACVASARYKNEAQISEVPGSPIELKATEVDLWEAWLDGQRSGAVEFHAPVGGTFDIAEAGAAALAIEVCAELNVRRI